LSPMLSAKLLRSEEEGGTGKLANWLDARFDSLKNRYQRTLHSTMNDKHVVALFGLIVLVSCYFLFNAMPQELAPEEYQGFIITIADSDPYATMEYFQQNTGLFYQKAIEVEEVEKVFLINGMASSGAGSVTNGIAGVVLKPWEQRNRSTTQVLEQNIQGFTNQIPGLKMAAFQPPPLPTGGGGGLPVEFVVGTTQPIGAAEELIEQILNKAYASRKFIFLDTDLKVDKPRSEIVIDREKAAALGIDMAGLSMDMAAMMAGAHANRFSLENRSYKVVPQVERGQRLNPEQLLDFYVRSRNGELIPLATISRLEEPFQPQKLTRFQQLNAITISAVQTPGLPLGEALDVLDQAAAEVLPQGYRIDYSGQSRQFKTEGSQLVTTFFFALIIIYLVLAAQFESWRDPIIMLVSVPMSIGGALLSMAILNIVSTFGTFNGLYIPNATMNIYTQVGLV